MTETAKILLLSFLAGSALIFPCRASATDEQWKYLTATEQGIRYFYDAESIIPLSGDVIQVRIKEIGSDGSTTSALEEINCAHKIVREREVVVEKRNRPPQVSHEITYWRAMERDPIMFQLFKVLCR